MVISRMWGCPFCLPANSVKALKDIDIILVRMSEWHYTSDDVKTARAPPIPNGLHKRDINKYSRDNYRHLNHTCTHTHAFFLLWHMFNRSWLPWVRLGPSQVFIGKHLKFEMLFLALVDSQSTATEQWRQDGGHTDQYNENNDVCHLYPKCVPKSKFRAWYNVPVKQWQLASEHKQQTQLSDSATGLSPTEPRFWVRYVPAHTIYTVFHKKTNRYDTIKACQDIKQK